MHTWLVRSAEEAPAHAPEHRTWLRITLAVCMILAVSWFLYPLAFWIGVLYIAASVIMVT